MQLQPLHRVTIAITAIVIAGMCLFPPWHSGRFPVDHAFVFAPLSSNHKHVDFVRLALQVGAVMLIALALCLAFPGQSRTKKSKTMDSPDVPAQITPDTPAMDVAPPSPRDHVAEREKAIAAQMRLGRTRVEAQRIVDATARKDK